MRRSRRPSLALALAPVLWLATAACSQILGIDDLHGPGDGGGGGPTVECQAQRVVHMVGGEGGLAWFTLVWPDPAVITGFQASFAYDDPANAKDVSGMAAHPLFARKLATHALWETYGHDPQPSVFVAGMVEIHTATPSTISINGGVGLDAAAAALQSSLKPTIAAMVFQGSGPYGTATGSPAPVMVADADGAIAALHPMISADVEQQLRPSAIQLSRYAPGGEAVVEIDLATDLALTANAFRLGLLGTVVIPAFDDDPHGAFQAGVITQRANDLATMLDAFYADLAASSDPSCGHDGQFVALADNVVTIVTGDTPKDPFDTNNWPDSTPGSANWMYMRSNGFTQPGWFGQVLASARTNFNPTTGALDTGTSVAGSTAAAFAGTLYAIARGNKPAVGQFTSAPYDGVILH